jgi:cytochrome d ubiquinol oxidase subunit I
VLWATILGFTAIYGTLAVIEVRLILTTIRKGPFEHDEDLPGAAGPAVTTPTQPLPLVA